MWVNFFEKKSSIELTSRIFPTARSNSGGEFIRFLIRFFQEYFQFFQASVTIRSCLFILAITALLVRQLVLTPFETPCCPLNFSPSPNLQRFIVNNCLLIYTSEGCKLRFFSVSNEHQEQGAKVRDSRLLQACAPQLLVFMASEKPQFVAFRGIYPESSTWAISLWFLLLKKTLTGETLIVRIC